MKMKFATLSILSVVALGCALQPANAQEGGARPGARFNYAPNVYRVDGPTMPHQQRYNGPLSNARAGSVPHSGSNFLGLTPQMLAHKPAPTIAPAARSVQATPSFTQVASHVIPQSFQTAFGTPVSPPAPVVAQALPPAQALTAPQMPAIKSTPAPSKPVAGHRVSTGVNGRLLTKHPVAGRHATPARALTVKPASYGNSYFQVGSIAPTSGSGGRGSSTSVTGVIVRH